MSSLNALECDVDKIKKIKKEKGDSQNTKSQNIKYKIPANVTKNQQTAL